MAPMASHGNGTIPSPYVELDRDDWARLREEHPMRLDAADVERLRGLGVTVADGPRDAPWVQGVRYLMIRDSEDNLILLESWKGA